MSEAKRYVPEFCESSGEKWSEMQENADGAWIRASDYDALAAKLAMAEDAAAKGDAARHQCGGMEMEIEELRAELAELRARVAVVPDASTVYAALDARERLFTSPENIQVALEAQSRINGLTVSEGLLRRLCEPLLSHADYVVARNELRALLGEEKEHE
ncbi:hypothetical protein FA454_32825 [Pseudomonas aeruginosa]|uniref:hypothetical protein n=1 Tax=Pseudomonas aeruginosa TaxID=287 RepID=UPI000AD76F4B|nr:hypothetical protein [Pseudomonas aeruginosa]MCO1686461.1 hypothetical protein [Pseudomonas aeruginosa]MCO1778239.1 hypothetical protein [Pseudomonas aeruginosa]MCO1791258.1 hypothetical protein [Pseudomonas aeruginosa]MCO1802758.1 hypothetical protein [Pseudomonas aeruginosa]MDV6504058.1 hypothetical protein [Pseudomonas aeruginosa]